MKCADKEWLDCWSRELVAADAYVFVVEGSPRMFERVCGNAPVNLVERSLPEEQDHLASQETAGPFPCVEIDEPPSG